MLTFLRAQSHAFRRATQWPSAACSAIILLTPASFHDCAQVRGASCLASGQVVRAFPAESAPLIDELFTQWATHLDDNVFSVRQDAACALADYAASTDEAGINRVLETVR